MKKVIIYDCDGVIFDSKEAVLAYYDFVCETYNLEKIDRNNAQSVNRAMMKTNTEILNSLTNNKNLVNEMLEFSKNMNFQKFLKYMTPEPNIYSILEQLRDKNLTTTIFTNRGNSLHYLLEHFKMDHFFNYKVTNFDVEKPKPSGEGLYKTLKYFNIDKSEALYIGDTTNDYYASTEADIDFIAYKNKLGNSPIIQDHLELLDYL